jgi:putative restriction endonuclease
MTLLETILTRVEPEHASALEWFVDHEGEIGARPWRRDGRSVVPGVTFPIVAQRGIHQPSGWSSAISITATASDSYMDGKPTPLGDGTWVLPYRAHGGKDGTGIDSRWNRALLANMLERLPVGVFVPERGSYRNLGLAMVEDYYEDQATFLLRGPVRHTQRSAVWQDRVSPMNEQLILAAESSEDAEERVPAFVRRRRSQDRFRDALLSAYDRRCAITSYEAEPALQAAHILAYSGTSSQKVPNGILLRADIHLLYDRHLLSVDPANKRIWLADSLLPTAYGELHQIRLRLPENADLHPDPEKLAVHWAVFSKAV